MLPRFPQLLGVIVLAACTDSAASHREMPRDTLMVSAPVATTNQSPVDSSSSPVSPPDTLASDLHAFVGFTAASGKAALPDLAMVAANGRRTGFDPESRRLFAELPGAYYDSSSTVADNDGGPDARASASKAGIDLRELHVPAHPGESYTLVVSAKDAGSFVLNVSLLPPGNAPLAPLKERSWESTEYALHSGEVRRLLVRVGDGTLEVRQDSSAH